MGCRSSFFMCYWTTLGVLYLASAMYAFLIFRSRAGDCQTGCAASILSPEFQTDAACGAVTATTVGDAAGIQAAYDARCMLCNGAVATVPCPPTLNIAQCAEREGEMLAAVGCASVAGTRVDAAELQTAYDSTAEGACIAYLDDPTTLRFADSTTPTTSLAGSLAGPGIQIIHSDASVPRMVVCTQEVFNNSFVAYGQLCYTTPGEFALRGLLVPGLLGFMLTFVAQFGCSVAAGLGLCFFRGVRRESWVRLTFIHRYVGACVLRMPACVRVCQMLTGVCLLGSLGFVLQGVCETALAPNGERLFFPAVRTLVLAGTIIWGGACLGGRMRATFHPDAGLAAPESAAATEPPEKPCSVQGCCQTVRSALQKYGP